MHRNFRNSIYASRCHRAGRAAGLSPLLPLLLSAVRAAAPPPPGGGGRQLLQQVIQSAASSAWSNAAPTRPWQALQGAPSALAVLESAAPVRPLQVIQSALPVRPLQTLAGRPGVYWLQNSQAVTNLQNAAASLGVPGAVGGGPGPSSDSQEAAEEVVQPAWAESRALSRRRRSLDADVEEVPDAEDLLDEAAQQMVEAPPSTSGEKGSGRQEKALQYLNMGGGYLAVGPEAGEFSALELDEAGLTLADEDGNELLSRAAPFRNRNQPDSPIYYIRLPPSPYVLVPGVGYVSSPGRRPLGGISAAAPPPPPPQVAPASSPFYNLPLAFMSNGKPTGVYQPSWGQPQRPHRPAARPPPQQSAMFSLNKGPYVFNGRPSDIFILRDSYDTLYGDALSSFYP
ncbi:Prokaryotic ubiquitin-like protein Pup [Frankliniella fusca]|uniref:Prokaryotic ubiquitin-like protein Pup n=1 Tax=Frankliniella fusca TaxID=407009 RepID=A0AAE1LQ41_9NEOP|nr:Prokaryotic ubiquitin-like protein Pup [Frankliniella fusca]